MEFLFLRCNNTTNNYTNFFFIRESVCHNMTGKSMGEGGRGEVYSDGTFVFFSKMCFAIFYASSILIFVCGE
jgi:hypothetical protein